MSRTNKELGVRPSSYMHGGLNMTKLTTRGDNYYA